MARGPSRRPRARTPCAGLLLLALSAWSVQAAAQDRPRLRPKPLPEASDKPAASNILSDQNSMGAPDAKPGAPAAPTVRPLAPAPPPLVLRSAVHSRYSRPATIARGTAGQCRAQCSEARIRCSSDPGDTGFCDPVWTQCLSTCDGLNYSRGP